jgi:hypothetical protein
MGAETSTQIQAIPMTVESENLSAYHSGLGNMVRGQGPGIHIYEMGAGIIKFATKTFYKVDMQNIYAQVHNREASGKGAHFDVYEDLLDERQPWLGLYNFAGEVAVKATQLPADLCSSYTENFTEANEAAHAARREYSKIAMLQPTATIYEGSLSANSGLVILQKPDTSYVVHDIVPKNTSNPGRYAKLLVPNKRSKNAVKAIVNEGFQPLDILLTESASKTQSPLLDADAMSQLRSIVAPTGKSTRSQRRSSRRGRGGGSSSGLLD